MSDAESLPSSPPADSISEANACIRGTTSPPYIDRLPVELLCRVCCWLPHFNDGASDATLNTRTPLWAPLLHVCSSWRAIAMECKELWSRIPLGHPEWTTLALRLSDPVAIALSVPGEQIFSPNNDDIPLNERLLKVAFTLVLEHLSRVSYLDLKLGRPESSNAEDGEAYTYYVRAREMLAPLRHTPMNRLASFRCVRADMRTGSFFEEDWTSQIRHLTLAGCQIPKSLRLSHLPLVSLSLYLPLYEDSFADWIALLGTLKSIEKLLIWDGLKPSYLDDIVSGAASSRDRIKFHDLKEVQLMRSPSLMGYYLRHFDLPLMAQIVVLWWAADFDVPGAMLPDSVADAEWPLKDDWGDYETSVDHKIYRLSVDLCKVLLVHVHGVVTDAQYKTQFKPATFTLPRTIETDERSDDWTMHGIIWAPQSSTFAIHWVKDTQPLFQDVFGVIGSMDTFAEWASLINVMREGDARDYARAHTVPALFSCVYESESLKRLQEMGRPSLTLVALQHVDFTNPVLSVYFYTLFFLLFVSDDERDPTFFDTVIVFPFGLKLSDEQRQKIMIYSIRISQFVEDYRYPEFEDVDPYV